MRAGIREQAQAWHDRMVDLAPRALEVLDGILQDSNAAPALRLRAAMAILKTAATPHPEPLPALESFSDKLGTAWDRYLARQTRPTVTQPPNDSGELHNVHVQNAESCTILHNAPPNSPIRRAPEPGRNSLCPCGSGLKYKRCCASYAPPRTAAARTSSATTA